MGRTCRTWHRDNGSSELYDEALNVGPLNLGTDPMIEFNNDKHGEKLAQRMGSVFSPKAEKVISRSERGVLYGGCIYDGHTGPAVGIHVVGMRPNWVNRHLIYFCFAYPFYQLKVDMLLGKVASTNKAALKLDLHLGFRVLYAIEGAVPGGDLLILRMDKNDCRWLDRPPTDIEIVPGGIAVRKAA